MQVRLYQSVLRQFIFALTHRDPETAHNLTVKALVQLEKIPFALEALKKQYQITDQRLAQEFFGLKFANPIGLAAGYLKNLEGLRGVEALGFGFIEGGTVTAHKQAGKERPRIQRFPKQQALVNRMGFPNKSARVIARNLANAKLPQVPLGINIGRSLAVAAKDLDAIIKDYLASARMLRPWANFIVINVSSPNTEGLRDLQSKNLLFHLIQAVVDEIDLPVFVKLSPDLTLTALDQALEVIVEAGAKGIIATNTTIQHGDLAKYTEGQGGLSGLPLFPRALEVVKHIRRQLPDMLIIGVGGIACAHSAWQFLQAGANLIQIFTGLIYQGPGLIRNLNRELLQIMSYHGIYHISELQQQLQARRKFDGGKNNHPPAR
jgi:dihydroorotate dehydrogenase